MLVSAFTLVSCEQANRHKDLTTEAFSEIKRPLFVINGSEVRRLLVGGCENTGLFADNKVRQYYADGGRMMWVYKYGVNNEAHKLLEHLKGKVGETGLCEDAFFI